MPEKVDPAPADASKRSEKPKRPRGRPKLKWDPFDDELFRRFQSGEARETVQAEAEYLHQWGSEKGLHVEGNKESRMIGVDRIRERMKKRYGGSAGYKQTRAWHRRGNGFDDDPD